MNHRNIGPHTKIVKPKPTDPITGEDKEQDWTSPPPSHVLQEQITKLEKQIELMKIELASTKAELRGKEADLNAIMAAGRLYADKGMELR